MICFKIQIKHHILCKSITKAITSNFNNKSKLIYKGIEILT
jgi:hypothetical protein